IRQVVVHKGRWSQLLEDIGLRTALAFPMLRRIDGRERKTQGPQILLTSLQEFLRHGRHAHQIVAMAPQFVARLNGSVDRWHTCPERFVEGGPKPLKALSSYPINSPSIHRPVGFWVPFLRPHPERSLPGTRVRQAVVQEDAVGVQRNDPFAHRLILVLPVQVTSCPCTGEMEMVASMPAVNRRKSASMPSEKITPLSGMRERILSDSGLPNCPYTRLVWE